MAIIRVEKTKDYTVMSNYHLRDTRLSFKAKGLMSQMLSMPDDWDFSVDGLMSMSEVGRTSVQAALKELEVNGYLERKREQDAKGRFNYVYVVSEKPQTENPCTDVPSTDSEQLLNTNILNTKKLNTNKRVVPPTLDEISSYIAEKGYKVSAQRFYDYYESRNWKTEAGKTMTGNWKQYVVTWNNKELERVKDNPKGYNSDWQAVNETTETQEERDERERRIRERLLSI